MKKVLVRLMFTVFLFFAFGACATTEIRSSPNNSEQQATNDSVQQSIGRSPKDQKNAAFAAFDSSDYEKLGEMCTSGNDIACQGKEMFALHPGFGEETGTTKDIESVRSSIAKLCTDSGNVFACMFEDAEKARSSGDAERLTYLCGSEGNHYACRSIKRFQEQCDSKDGNACVWIAVISRRRAQNENDGASEYRRYVELACSYRNKDACRVMQEAQKQEAAAKKEEEDKRAAEARAKYEQTTQYILGTWLNSPIDSFIEGFGAPSEVVPIGRGKVIYRFVDFRGNVFLSGIGVPIQCTIDMYVRNGTIYSWRTNGNAGLCRGYASLVRQRKD